MRFLDNLYVAPEMRGGVVADALFARLAAIGIERGWSSLRWLTADDNYRARRLRLSSEANDVDHLSDGSLA